MLAKFHLVSSLGHVLSCGDYMKYKDEKVHIEDARVEFEYVWLSNLVTSGQLVIFPPHLQEINMMGMREAIRTHQVHRNLPIYDDLLLLFVPQSFIALNYKRMKAYGNHFRVDDE